MPSLKQMQEQGDVPPAPLKLDEGGKKEWASTGRPFDVLSCERKEAEGGRHYWDCLVASLGETYQLGLSTHANRDGAMRVIAEESSKEPVEGCCLRVLSKMRGTEFYVIDAAD